MQINRNPRWPSLFFAWTIFVTITCLVFLFLIPPDPKNQVFLGYSLSRWLMALGFVALALAVLFVSKFLPRRPIARQRIEAFFFSQGGFWAAFLLLVLLIAASLWLALSERFSPYFARLLPLAAWGFAFLGGCLAFQLVLSRFELARQAWSSFTQVLERLWQACLDAIWSACLFLRASLLRTLGLALLVALSILFQNALRFDLPLGYAGLYTLMSDALANNHFLLPQAVAYYGPGGMPYAYPPLAFYLMAFVTHVLGLPVAAYLRFAAPLFAWLCIIPAFFLAFELTGSRLASLAASLILASSGYMYLVHAEAGGIVRSLAFFFALCGLYFFYRLVRCPGWKFGLLAAAFFGLTVLTHLSYALFFALGVAAYALARPLQLRRWALGLLVGLGGALVSAPWWLVVLSRYGIQVLGGPLGSHGNDYFLAVFTDLNKLLPWIEDGVSILRLDAVLFGLVITGLVYALAVKKFYLPVWFALLVLFISEGWRFTIFVGALLAGGMIAEIYRMLNPGGFIAGPRRGAFLRGLVFVGLLLLVLCGAGANAIAAYSPVLTPDAYRVAGFFQQKTQAGSTFLLAAGVEESEWFPYLLQRTPLVASWGAEWTGAYAAQLGYVLEVVKCEEKQSLSCLDGVFAEVGRQPDYLITHTSSDTLTTQIEGNVKWQKVYQDGTYLVWLNRKLNPELRQ